MGTTESTSQPDIGELRDRMREAYAAGDAQMASELYVDDAVQQPPGRPAAVGRGEIRTSYEMLFAHGGLSLRMDPWQTVASDREARERGAYHLAAGQQTLLAGKYMAVMAKGDDGGWRYVWSTVTPD